MILVKINAEDDTLLAQKHHISGYPTGVLINADESEIDRIVGYAEVDEYLQILRDYKKGIGTLDDLLNRAKTEEDRNLYFEIADKFKYRGGQDDAISWFNKVIESGEPKDSLSTEGRMAIANLFYRAKDYPTALGHYKAVSADFADGYFGEESRIWQGLVLKKVGDTTMALSVFESFIKNFPEAVDFEYVTKQIAKLKPQDEEEEKE